MGVSVASLTCGGAICCCVHGFASSCRGRRHDLCPSRYSETDDERRLREARSNEVLEMQLCDEATVFKGQPFGGIIADLRSKCGGNVHEKGVVTITGSGNHSNQPHQVADGNWQSGWMSKNERNSWIQFDFKDKSVCATHYTLRVMKSWNYPGHFELSGSDDGSSNSWTVLDRRDTDDLCGSGCSHGEGRSFTCESKGHFFRFIRLTQTGKLRYNRKNLGSDYLQLSEVEFFGSVRVGD